jgi:aspartyl-tRNA(Asn)/glutamyl-tRNA(Gln) amidotransferase subunit A
MSDKPLWQLSALEMSEGFSAGIFSPTDVTRQCLARIEAVNPVINAWITLDHAFAFEQAAQSTTRWQRHQPLSSLDGVPIGIKDNILMKGLPTTWGSRALKDFRSDQTEVAVSRILEAGLVVFGKTSVPEFTLEGFTANDLIGVTANPWDNRLTPGGSSGGSAAAVASSMVPLAIGTDAGGSIRRPASHCGLYALKTSLGAIERDHTLPSILLDFEVVGPIAKTGADLAAVDEVLRPNKSQFHLLPPDSVRILYVPKMLDAPVDQEIDTGCAELIINMFNEKHLLTYGNLPESAYYLTEHWSDLGQIGLAKLFQDHPQWMQAVSPKHVEAARKGKAADTVKFYEFIQHVLSLRLEADHLFQDFDFIITPATAALAWANPYTHPETIDGQRVGARGHALFSGWVNAAGLPAVALPVGLSASGKPYGIQVIARRGHDDWLIHIAKTWPIVLSAPT